MIMLLGAMGTLERDTLLATLIPIVITSIATLSTHLVIPVMTMRLTAISTQARAAIV